MIPSVRFIDSDGLHQSLFLHIVLSIERVAVAPFCLAPIVREQKITLAVFRRPFADWRGLRP
jgi:hypothetical protein